ncbi:MAG: alpha/beta fold hydrolase [Candidatus Aminicenantaceae bacterium]
MIMKWNDSYLNVKGNDIRLVEKGSGSPVMLLHGIGASLEWWNYNINFLSKKNRVIAFDFLGFGLSSKPDIDFNIELAQEFMLDFINTLGLKKVSLVGNSMGGLIALGTAITIPEKIDKLILVDNAGFDSNLSFFLRLGTVFPLCQIALSAMGKMFLRFFLKRMFYDLKKMPLELEDCILKMFQYPKNKKVFCEVLKYGVNIKGLKKRIWSEIVRESLTLPHKTLIVWGENDKVIPVSQAYKGKELIKNSTLHIFEQCGHIPQVEYFEEFNRLVQDFLNS